MFSLLLKGSIVVSRYVNLQASALRTDIPDELLDRCLKIVDPDLFAHLRSKNLSAEIYAFPCALIASMQRLITRFD